MKVFGGPKQPRRLIRLNKFGADRHSQEYDAKKLERRKYGAERHMEDYNKRKLTAGSVLRYTHMPNIFGRIRALGQQFGHFAFMLALVFRSARLLPMGHPMLNPANIGRYGVRDVIATAANNLVMTRQNIDQIVVFGAVVVAMIMVVVQAFFIAIYAFISSAHAAITTPTGLFTTPAPDADLAFQFMRNVFGVADIFGTLSSTMGTTGDMQQGLHAILGFYSTAMMLVAVLIVLYHVVVVVGESAQSGKPFGGRFNSLWAPIRLVLALGLLVPLGGGLNAAQYMVLYIAKMGSGLATQGWMLYAAKMTPTDNRVVVTKAPSIEALAKAVFISEACRAAYNKSQNHIGAGQVQTIAIASPDQMRRTLNAVSVSGGAVGVVGGAAVSAVMPQWMSRTATFDNADLNAAIVADSSSITYVWTRDSAGGVVSARSTCGALVMNVPIVGGSGIGRLADTEAQRLTLAYMGVIKTLIASYSAADGPATMFANRYITMGGTDQTITDEAISAKLATAINTAQQSVNTAIQANGGVTVDVSERTALMGRMSADASSRGWTTAGIYYLEIARANQMINKAVNDALPFPADNPRGAEPEPVQGAAWDLRWFLDLFFDDTAADAELTSAMTHIQDIVMAANSTTQAVNSNGVPITNASDLGNKNVWTLDPTYALVKLLFGEEFIGLLDNPSLDPMSHFISAGSAIMTRAMWVFAGAVATKVASVAVSSVNEFGANPGLSFVSGMLDAVGPILWFFMTVGLAAGIILLYVVPAIPFMYFFFSVVNWVIEVAEAFISMPLFALAHLRIDGDGLPGQTAYNGYLTLFGVMLRPLLIIMGLIIASLIFGAASYYLGMIYKNFIFAHNPATAATGAVDFDNINGIDITIYMILYVYTIYILANSTFKLIDKVPDEMMRWIGGNRGFTGDRPVDLGNMQGMALAGYAAFREGAGAANQSVQKAQKAWNDRQGKKKEDPNDQAPGTTG